MKRKTRERSKTSFYICLVLGALMILAGVISIFSGTALGDVFPSLIIGVCFLVPAYFLKRRNDQEAAARKRAYEKRQSDIEAIHQRAQASYDAEKQRKAEWNRTHGRIVTKVVGVTHDNEDGTSRQRILKQAYTEDACEATTLELYDYKGHDAIAVLYNGEQIGNIPKNMVPDVKAVMDKITAGSLRVDRFRPEDEDGEEYEEPRGIGGYIYHAELSLVYPKEPSDAT